MTIIAALFIALGVSSGAHGQGQVTREVFISFMEVDSTNLLVGNALATSQINDSIFFFSPEFFYNGPWSNMVTSFVISTKDTSTQTGLCRDSVEITLQTQLAGDSVKLWRNIGATTKWPLSAWDSTGTAAANAIGNATTYTKSPWLAGITGVGGPYRGIPSSRISIIEADSAAAIGQVFRFMTMYSAEEDSIKSHMALKSNAVLKILSKLNAVILFHLR
jgi:hypothetical protein